LSSDARVSDSDGKSFTEITGCLENELGTDVHHYRVQDSSITFDREVTILVDFGVFHHHLVSWNSEFGHV
jgi:hypothetical protein